MRKKTKKDLSQRFNIVNNGENSSIKWDKDGFTFWRTKGTGLVRPYERRN
jgi:hypothetical protein